MFTWKKIYLKVTHLFSLDKNSRSLRKYLKKSGILRTSKTRQILVEANQSASNQLGLSLFLPQLRMALDAKVLSYTMGNPISLRAVKDEIRARFGILSGVGLRKNKTISSNIKPVVKRKTLSDYGISDSDSLDLFAMDGIRIGDLIYDSYLRKTNKPTIDIGDPDLESLFLECISYFNSWKKYLDENTVVAICISHCVYHYAIPARIAFSQNIRVFQVTAETIYSLDKSKTHAYTEFMNFREQFEILPETQKESGIAMAQERLALRFHGKTGVDMAYSTKSAFESDFNQFETVITPSNRTKILVATHDFFDSPHSYGDNFYPDFYLWLTALGEISKLTDYDWYIKLHRDSVADDTHIIQSLLVRYPRFKLLPKDISHHQIIQDGIDFALTVYGTIAMEYPALGVKVINASRNNPHVNFEFSITPESRKSYEEMLLNLTEVSYKIKKSQISEYYYMAHLHNPKSWIYLDYEKYLSDIGGYQKAVSTDSYIEFLREGSNRREMNHIREATRNFISSSDYKLSATHFKSEDSL